VDRRHAGARAVVHDVGHQLRRALPGRLLEVLKRAGEAAEALGMRAYLVGGAVRDVLLGRECEDVDVVVEGNGLELARTLARRRAAAATPTSLS